MDARSLRRRFSDAHLEAIVEACRGGADRATAFFSIISDLKLLDDAERTGEAARRAARLLDAFLIFEEHDEERRRHLASERAALAGGGWLECARVGEQFDRFDPWLGPAVVGSLAIAETVRPSVFEINPRLSDGSLAAEAVAVALREISSDVSERQRELLEAETLVGFGERDALARFDRALNRLRPEFVGNARLCGRETDEAEAAALAAAGRLRGRALSRRPETAGRTATAHALGASAVRSCRNFTMERRSDAEDRPDAWRLGRMIDVARQINDAKSVLTGGSSDGKTVRFLGSAALGAAFGFGHGWRRPAPVAAPVRSCIQAFEKNGVASLMIDGMVPVDFSEDGLRSLSPLSLDAARHRLEALSTDPRRDRRERESAARLAEAVSRSAAGWRSDRVSFGSHVGLAQGTPLRAELEDGVNVFWAAPVGRHPSACLAEGRRRRPVRCRALADDQGNLVGYAGFDALSGEFGGEGIHAVYDLDGRRFGWLKAGGAGGRVKRGEPPWGFMTAPATIPLK